MKKETDVIYLHPKKRIVSQQQKYIYLSVCGFYFLLIGLFSDSISNSISGLYRIVTSPSNLLTDYFYLGGFGSAFINSGILTLLAVFLTYRQKVLLNGPMFAAILTVTGCSFFGKNLYNSIAIILGVYLYAKFVKKPFSQYVMIGLFGSALSPVVSYVTFGMDLPLLQGIILGNLAGILIGLLLPPLSVQALVFHQGFTLYNIGFTSGLIAMGFTGVLRLFSYSVENNTMISTDHHTELLIIMYCFFCLTVFLGVLFNGFRFKGLRDIFKTSGKLITDFILIAGLGPTLINMGLMGIMLISYVVVVQGQLNGPVIGAILSAVGFSAFGNHLRNSFPILVGITIASLFGTFYDINHTAMLVAAAFGTGLAPISGFYGSFYGILAGFLHIALVHNVSSLHGGLNLYNSGFSTGFVAGIMVPVLDNFTALRKEKQKFGKRDIKKNR